MAAATYGAKFNEKNLPKQILYPLRDAGYVVLTRGTRETGRGAKPFLVTTTEKFASDLLTPLLEQLELQAQADLRPLLRNSLEEIRGDLKATNRHKRGLALEALAFKLMRLIDLTYVATRLRGAATGGAEVDLLFEGARLVLPRWQVHCKNTDRVSLDDVAREVGLAHFLKSNVILIVTTGQVGPDALAYAELIRSKLPISICCLSGDDLRSISESPMKVVDLQTRAPTATAVDPYPLSLAR